MRIAIISDIHANLEALESVLKDIDNRNVEKIICLGDIIARGVHAHECIELVKKRCDIVVHGNAELWFCGDPEKAKINQLEQTRMEYNRSLLTQEDMNYLNSLPFSEEFYISGNLVRLFHAHPTTCFKLINDYERNFQEKLKLFQGTEKTKTDKTADIVIYGHIHYPYMQKLYNKTLINCGSVGNSICTILDDKYNSNPDEVTSAHYVIIEGDYDSIIKSDIGIEFRSVKYDIEKELRANLNNPEFESYKVELTEGRSRNSHVILDNFKKDGYNF